MFVARAIGSFFGGGESRLTHIPHLLFGGLTYPLWHLITPAGARDPWAAWWVVGATFVLVTIATSWSTRLEPYTRGLYTCCAALVTTHIFVLAAINGMQPFYAVGSSLAIVTTTASIRSIRVLLTYAAYVATIGIALYVFEPDSRKIAFWGGMFPIIALAYQRLSAQIAAVDVAHQYQERLEQSVEERTADLADANRRLRREINERARLEEELRIAQKMEAVGRLAGGVAHEFNNLLTTIRLYAELTRDGLPEESPLHPELEYILKAGRQASHLTGQLLAFSRRDEVVAEVLDLNRVLSDNASMLRHLLGEDVRLVCDFDESQPVNVRAGRGEVEQVLVNLALNARDAMPDGGRVTLQTAVVRRAALTADTLPRTLTDDQYAMLSVGDTGIGMDAEIRHRAFDPFFTRKHVGEGTGLGLSIVYGILDQRGGHVRVQSEAGKGAHFELYWPLAGAGAGSDEGSPAHSSSRAAGSGERILLVEDEADLRVALSRVLSHAGYDVTQAEDAVVALATVAAASEPFGLVISDVVMPHMSGLELVERLAGSGARTLLISGQLNHPSLRTRALPETVRLLPKPFDVEELIENVRAVLEDA